jgi:tetratricopeptide (TPR) repeat protein
MDKGGFHMGAERWWISMGYPEFESGEDGFPRPGQVTKHYRYLKKRGDGQPWTQKDLAYVLGISENEVRNMENRDRGFPLERRRFLAQLLNIPPILYGVVTLEQIEQMLTQQQAALPARAIASTKRVMVDLEQCRQALTGYWEANHAHTVQDAIPDIHSWIALINKELSFMSDSQQKAERYELLTDFYQLLAMVLRDRQSFQEAMPYLDEAVEMAKFIGDKELLALTFDRRGSVWLDQGMALHDPHALQAAVHDYQEALALEKHLPPSIHSALLLRGGHALARVAQSEKERTKALSLMDQAGRIIRNGGIGNPHGLKLDITRYHIDKGAALIALGRSDDAIAELSLVTDDSAIKRRSAYRDILLAQAYANKGDYAYAAELAAPALQIVKDINSQVNITRIAALYTRLKNSPLKNDPEVERLAWLLYAR